jgi:large conductance mechanosensitive channel
MGILKEFREFAMKGNIVDLAVAVIIGTAFGAIIKALTDKILMPVIGSFVGKDFETLGVTINGVNLQYGAFIQAVINFFVIAFFVFLLVKAMNKVMRKQEPPPAPPTEEVLLLREIRDSLKK